MARARLYGFVDVSEATLSLRRLEQNDNSHSERFQQPRELHLELDLYSLSFRGGCQQLRQAKTNHRVVLISSASSYVLMLLLMSASILNSAAQEARLDSSCVAGRRSLAIPDLIVSPVMDAISHSSSSKESLITSRRCSLPVAPQEYS